MNERGGERGKDRVMRGHTTRMGERREKRALFIAKNGSLDQIFLLFLRHCNTKSVIDLILLGDFMLYCSSCQYAFFTFLFFSLSSPSVRNLSGLILSRSFILYFVRSREKKKRASSNLMYLWPLSTAAADQKRPSKKTF